MAADRHGDTGSADALETTQSERRRGDDEARVAGAEERLCLIQLAFGRLDNWPLGAAISVISIMAVTLAVCLFLLGTGQIKKLVR